MSIAERWKGYKDLPENIIDRLNDRKEFWERNKDVLLVYLFGSLSEKGSGNDIDLAILFEKRASYRRITELLEDLYGILGTQRIDIVDLGRASPVFKFDVMKTGKLFFARDAHTLNNFEHKVIKEHMDTAYLRRIQGWYLRKKALNKG